jgi:hypothetical protein
MEENKNIERDKKDNFQEIESIEKFLERKKLENKVLKKMLDTIDPKEETKIIPAKH